MKKTLFIISNFVLGCMVSSCQNDLEEVLNVNDKLQEVATTRTSVDESVEDVQYFSLEAARSITLNGSSIMVGTNTYFYEVSGIVSGTNLNWDYDANVVDSISRTTAGIYLKLKNANSTENTYVRANFIDPSTNTVVYSVFKNVGANGPHYADCSIRVVRSSDGLEAYPSPYGLRPNTWYYGYFSTTTGANLSLSWDFTYSSCSDPTGTPVYFKSGANGYDLVNVYGTLSGSSVVKLLLGVTLYGGSDYNGFGEDESDKDVVGITEEE